MSKIIDLYTSMLRAAGLVTTSDGCVSINNQLFTGIANEPALINGKRIVLPTMEHLRRNDPNYIVFHPLREQAMRGESETTARLRKACGVRLNMTFLAVMNEYLKLAENRGQHKTLDPDQAMALVAGKDVTDGTRVAFTELIKRMEDDNTKPAVALYVKKSAVIKDRNYFRAGIVTFPLYEELKEEKPLGYAISEKERKNLQRVMEYIMPGIETPNAYDQGSNSGVAPFLDALMKAFGVVAARLNDQIDLFKDVFLPPSLRIDDDWVEPFADLDSLEAAIQLIPQQLGNDGATATGATNPATPATTQISRPEVKPKGSTISFTELLAKAEQQRQQPVVFPQPVMQPPHNPMGHLQGYAGMPAFLPGVGMVPQSQMQQMMQMQHQQMHQPANAPRGNWGPPAMPGYGGGGGGNAGTMFFNGMAFPLSR